MNGNAETRWKNWLRSLPDFPLRHWPRRSFLSEHGADAGTPVSGPSLCSPASPRAGDKGVGLKGKPPVPRRVGEPGNKVLTK